MSDRSEYFSTKSQRFCDSEENADDYFQQSSSNSGRDQYSEIDAYERYSESDDDQKRLDMNSRAESSNYSYSQSITSKDNGYSTSYSDDFEKYGSQKVISISVLADETCFELQDGRVVKVPRSKTLRFVESTKLSKTSKFSFLTFDEADRFFDTLKMEQALNRFAQDVEMVTFYHYFTPNVFRRLISAIGANITELKLINILLPGDDEVSKSYNEQWNISQQKFAVKEIIKAMLSKCLVLRRFRLDLRLTKIWSYEVALRDFSYMNMSQFEFLQIDVRFSLNNISFVECDKILHRILLNNGKAVITLNRYHHSFLDILSDNGYYRNGETSHCIAGSTKQKLCYQIYQRENSKVEYHVIKNCICVDCGRPGSCGSQKWQRGYYS